MGRGRGYAAVTRLLPLPHGTCCATRRIHRANPQWRLRYRSGQGQRFPPALRQRASIRSSPPPTAPAPHLAQHGVNVGGAKAQLERVVLLHTCRAPAHRNCALVLYPPAPQHWSRQLRPHHAFAPPAPHMNGYTRLTPTRHAPPHPHNEPRPSPRPAPRPVSRIHLAPAPAPSPPRTRAAHRRPHPPPPAGPGWRRAAAAGAARGWRGQ